MKRITKHRRWCVSKEKINHKLNYKFMKVYDLDAVLLATRELMFDNDYKKRFTAEYWQLRVRFEKLKLFLFKIDSGTLGFTPSSPIKLLKEQFDCMFALLQALEKRATIENVELEEFAEKFIIN